MPSRKIIPFALLGFGKMGQGFYLNWQEKREKIKEQTGFDLLLEKILIRNESFKRPSYIDDGLLTTNIDDILTNKNIKIAIDVVGGIEPTFSIIKKIIKRKIHVISSNRMLLASKMHELSDLANENEIYFLTESSLGGGIPVAGILQRDLVANKIERVYGIMSGMSNFILSEMTQNKVEMETILSSPEVASMGETISVIDYAGSDAAMKVAILAATAFGIDINYLHLFAEGISEITQYDVECADEFGYEIKPLAILKEHPDNFEIRVHPTMVPKHHPMVQVKGKNIAYYIQTDLMGEYMVYGEGTGTNPTASLILRDLVDIGNRIYNNPRRQKFQFDWNTKPVLKIEDIKSPYYIRFPCEDKPGVMGNISSIIGKFNMNILSAHAEVRKIDGESYGYVHIFIENSYEKDIFAAINVIKQRKMVKGKVKLIRILDDI